MSFYILLFIGVILYLFFIMPRMCNRPDFSCIMGWFYAHRGLHDKECKVPENSMGAFQLAVENGYGIELDVQLTKDNQVVVFHDFNLKRICNIDSQVCDLTYSELQQQFILATQEKIPLFQDVLKLVDGKVPLIVELKCKNWKDRIAYETNKILENYQGVYCIESFHPMALAWYRKNRPDIIRGQLSDIFKKTNKDKAAIVYFMHSHLLFNVIGRPDFIAYNHCYQNEISRKICRNLFHALSIAWTVRSEQEYMNCKENFDLFIFEYFKA